ncbi:MAG: alpha-amylase family glycosyl hydrolase [Minicystis sp.]
MSSARPMSRHPSLYEIFTRVWLGDLSRAAGSHVTLATVPDAVLDRLAMLGFDYVYLMGVWTLGEEGARISRTDPELRLDYDLSLHGWKDEDVLGSPFAVARYTVAPAFGGDEGLASLRARLAERGMGLVLDFVPNHVARDHHWVKEQPALFLRDEKGALAPGKDPYFAPWKDTAQLDIRLQKTRAALIAELGSIAERCDGVRCDMAMLVIDEVFRKSWAKTPPIAGEEEAKGELWAEAIDTIRARFRGFLFVAEAYWDREWRLQMLGFDYTYDKSFYDRLVHGSAPLVRGHLAATLDYQRRCVRFVENHDEQRISSVLPSDRRNAATVLAATVPGMRLFHEGQLEGRELKASLHLARRAEEPVHELTLLFHEKLLDALRHPALREGNFAQLQPREAAPNVPGAESIVAHRWDSRRGAVVVIVNFSASRSRSRITLDLEGSAGRSLAFTDLFTGEVFLRDGDELIDPARGLYVELAAYAMHFFSLRRNS